MSNTSNVSELQVTSTAEYVALITQSKLPKFYHDTAHLQIMYRGHADISWDLQPTAFRNTSDFLNERIYLQEFQRQLPQECTSSDLFDILVKAQHYGIPTRLFDVTTNPLIALYFACESLSQTTGCVFSFGPTAVFSQDDYTVQVIMQYLFKYKHLNDWDERFSHMITCAMNKSDSKFFLSSTEKIIEILSKHHSPIFISPKLSNDRVRAQHGAFALFSTPLQEKNNDNGIRQMQFLLPTFDSTNTLTPANTIIIPPEFKEKILWELDCLGVSKSTLFHGIDIHISDIIKRVRYYNKDINEKYINKI